MTINCSAERVAQLKANNIRQQEAVADAMTGSLAASKNELDQPKVQLDYLCNLLSSRKQNQLASTQNLAALEGWIESTVQALEACLTEQSSQSIQTREIDRTKIWFRQSLKTMHWWSPELVTEMYSRFQDKGPTLSFPLFYFVFFGMMVADIGYGLYFLCRHQSGAALLACQVGIWIAPADSSACWVYRHLGTGLWFFLWL